MNELKSLLDAALAVTAEASKLGIQLPEGLTKVIVDLAKEVNAAEVNHESVGAILAEVEAILAKDEPALKAPLDDVAKALAAAKNLGSEVKAEEIKLFDVFNPPSGPATSL